MKIDLSTINRDQFMCHTHLVGDEMVMLVQSVHIGCEWNKENTIFRSSVWDMDGNPVSLSFKKFYNWGEKPHLCPPPESLGGAQLMEKIDGSTLIFSRWKGKTIIRTRGTVDARKQENGHEIDVLCQKYPDFIKMLEGADDLPFSYVFEWTSPTNQIVINYGFEPDMVLTGIVRHVDYSYENQATLDTFAEVMGLRRPQTYAYDSVEAMKQAVTDFKGVEGVCVYFHDDQKILKVKGAQYLYLHRAKSEISSIEKVMDLYLATFLENGSYMPYQAFMEYLEKTFDFEIAQMARSNVSLICDGMKEVRVILTAMRAKLATISGMSRKDQAGIILQAWGTTGRSALAFKMLDNKALVPDDYKKLLFQILK